MPVLRYIRQTVETPDVLTLEDRPIADCGSMHGRPLKDGGCWLTAFSEPSFPHQAVRVSGEQRRDPVWLVALRLG